MGADARATVDDAGNKISGNAGVSIGAGTRSGNGALALGLAACGAKRDLKPPAGKLPPQPAASPAPRTYEDMAKVPPQGAPDRVNDPLSKSQPRPDDRFDLPPPG